MTTFHLENDNAVGGQEKFVASGLPTPSTQVSPQIRGSVPVDTANETQATPNPTASEPMLSAVVYEGYQFFKADPTTGQKATWNRVERTQMHLSQGEFYKMVQKRANKVSAVQQYQNLSDTRRAHVNQLIHEQRRNDPSVEWSCVYAKERDRPSKARNAHRDDYETVSMDIILMKRPIKTKSYPRTPMGDLVELDMPFRNDHNSTSAMMMPPGNPATKPFMPGQVIGPGYVVQGPLPRPVSVTSPFTRLDLGHPAAEDQFIGMGGHTALENENRNMEHDAGWSSEEVDSEDDDESMIFDQSPSRMSSETAHPDNMDCECQQTPQPSAQSTPRQRSCSPARREPGLGSHFHRKSKSRNMERRLDRYHPLRYYYMDMMAAKNGFPVKRARGLGMGADPNRMWEKKYRIHRIDDEELRSRLLDCEARIEHWERAFENQTRILQKTMEDSHQLRRCRSFWDFSSMRHCGCDCPKTSGMGNND